jgi:peptide methionine sulfoxide reductase msrA/msrB
MKRALLALILFACRSAAPVATAEPPQTNGAQHVYSKPSDAEIKKKLTPLQYEVTQHEATEPPFANAYWDNHKAGIYVDVVTGEPLFSSADKFESGTGWPSFTQPINVMAVKTHSDTTLGMERTEVRSAIGDSHLGHVFDDGPAPSNMRYCINSASLRFVAAADLAVNGYGEYAARFGGAAVSIAPATSNSCVKPAPGEKPGCNTTLGIAVLSSDGSVADVLKKTPGVLQVERGTVGGKTAARVIYDPKTISYEHLLAAWAGAKPAASVVYPDESAFSPSY